MKQPINAYVTILLAVITVACAAPMGGGETGTGYAPVSKGRITGFGSVFVNGVEFQTGLSSFKLDDSPGSESDLSIGMVVTVSGAISSDGTTGVATAIEFADELEGVVDDVSGMSGITTGTMTVMGQTVHVDSKTVYTNSSADNSLATIDMVIAGHVVEVSGFAAGDGNIYATRIELKQTSHAGEEIELKGIAHTVNTGAGTFFIGSKQINYTVSDLDNLTEADLVAGDGSLYVEVKTTAYTLNSPIDATKVEIEGTGELGIHGSDGQKMELEGVITSNPGGNSLSINGQAVIMPNTFNSADVVTGEKFEVEGVFNADGVLVVSSYETREEGEIYYSANVTTVDVQNRQLTILGKTLPVVSGAVMEDKRNDGEYTPLKYFGLEDIADSSSGIGGVGDWLIVNIRNDNGTLKIVEVIRDDDPATGEVTVEGLVAGSAMVSATDVGGITVDCSGVSGGTCGPDGEIIAVEGTFSGSLLTALRIK